MAVTRRIMAQAILPAKAMPAANGRRSLLILLSVFLALGSSSADAQWGYLSPDQGASMTREDSELQRSAALSLLNSGRVGDSVPWSNPRSGTQGEVSLLSVLEDGGMPCRQVKYSFLTRGASSQREAVLKMCRRADGSWHITD